MHSVSQFSNFEQLAMVIIVFIIILKHDFLSALVEIAASQHEVVDFRPQVSIGRSVPFLSYFNFFRLFDFLTIHLPHSLLFPLLKC